MKKLLILLTILSFNSFGQSSFVAILDAAPNLNMSTPVNVGASTYIGMDYYMYTQDSFLLYVIQTTLLDNNLDTCHNRIPVGIYTIPQLSAMPTYTYGINNNQAHKLSFNIPSAPTANNYRVKIHAYGNCSVDCNGNNVLHSICAAYANINNPNSIQQYAGKENLLKTEYFDLLGQPIPRPDGITVEVKTYSDGKKEVKKILPLN